MTREEAEERFIHAWQTKDLKAIREVLGQYPAVLLDRPNPNSFLNSAARFGENEILEILLDMGLPIDFQESTDLKNGRPIESAAALKRSETVRFLVQRGAAINDVADDGSPRCYALYSALLNDDLDLARFLIAHGANINAVNERGTSVLSFALKMRPEFADELRALGAKETHELPGYVPPPIKHPVVRAVEERLCEAHPLTWLAEVPDEVPVAIHTVFHLDHYCLFTSGMSERAMTVPPGGEAYRFAELVLYLDGWDTDVDEWQTPEHLWVINWVRRLAQIPFENDTWLNGKWTIISNEDPPRPLSEFTQMTCWLLLGEKEPLARAELPDGKSVCFYTLMPLHTAERDFALDKGILALLRRFDERGVYVPFDPDRPSVI